MPTYDYECSRCGHTFEAFQKMSDAALTACPKCAGQLRRLIGAGAGIIFKGSGFYATDYRKKDAAKPAQETPSCDKQQGGACKGCPNAE